VHSALSRLVSSPGDPEKTVNTHCSVPEERRTATIAMIGVSLFLLSGASGCGVATDGEPATPSPLPPRSSTHAPSTATTASAGTRSVTPDQIPPTLDEELVKRARTEGTISVIVTLDVPYRPEANLASPAEIAAQRTAIAAAQDELAASVPDATVTTRMTLFPQIVLSVNENGLRQLAASPLVLAIDENSLSAPTS
jgi:hypothetical protein